MTTRIAYEKQLLDEISGLSAHEMARVLKLVHLVKEEFLKPKGTAEKESIMDFAGCLRDISPKETELFDEAINRRQMFDSRDLAL